MPDGLFGVGAGILILGLDWLVLRRHREIAVTRDQLLAKQVEWLSFGRLKNKAAGSYGATSTFLLIAMAALFGLTSFVFGVIELIHG